ncbi:MAG: hypothetical protein HQ564_01110 [Candidatus Saganbacteria bacterium]|nr:hypothetical protein [Candidatus Saganbacteria bacterium]
MKRLFAVLFLFFSLFSSFSFAENYPKINISGFKKWEYKTLDVNPKSNYFLGLTQIGFSPSTSGLSWQERLSLAISADLSKELKVIYNIQQEPETPERFDVSVSYDKKHELIFGDISATFSGNEFASATKSLNGVMVKSKGNNHNLLFVPASKLRSQVQSLTTQKGNSTRGPYSLGHGSIVEGSERIELNGIVLKRKTDYVIDYFEGKITFREILTTLDEFKYSYEYTNILDLFFPTLSKRNFIGFQGDYTFYRSDYIKDQLPEFTKTATKDAFPNPTYSLTDETQTGIASDESILYRISKFPAVEFSEQVSFEGRTLVKGEDYRLDYNEGLLRIYLLSPTSLNPLFVSYQYYGISREADRISGIGSKGDYFLERKGIVVGSEKVKVDGKKLLRGFDYKIDYEKGTLFFFYEISNTSLIEASYQYKVEDKKKKEAKKKQTYATVGVTFLSESAKQGSGLPTSIAEDKIKGPDIISNQNTIYLKNIPFVPSSEGGVLTVTKNGTALLEGTDYVIPSVEANAQGEAVVTPATKLAFINDKYDLSDGYDTGTIRILSTIEATDEVNVAYTYYNKTVFGKYSYVGNGGNDYEIKNYRNIIRGSEIVRVTVLGSSIIKTYKRNSSAEAYDGDYSINYYNENPPEISFNQPLSTDKSFTIEFRYVPPAADKGGDIKQDVFGMDLDFKLGKHLQFSGEMATSNKDKVVSIATSSESFSSFAAATRRIQLANRPLIENSENVYLNNYLRNRDIDYSIDYTSGYISFYYVTLGTQDSVSVDYSYESATGATQQTSAKVDRAYKYGVKSSLGFFDFSYDKKDIGSSFSPMGGLSLGLGSNAQNFSTIFKPKYHDLSIKYDYKETNNPLSGKSGLYTRNYDRRYEISINPKKRLKMGLNFRRYQSRTDDDVKSYDQFDVAGHIFPAKISRGIFALSQKYEARKSKSDDLIAGSKTSSDFFYFQEDLNITKRVKLSYNYQVSEPRKIINLGTAQESVTSESFSKNYAYSATLDLKTGKLYKWTAYAKVVRAEQHITKPSVSIRETRNITYSTDFRPHKIMSTRLDYNRSETPSVVVENKNPMNERTSLAFSLNPNRRLNGGYSYSENGTVYTTGREGSGRSNSYNFNFVPLKSKYLELSQKLSLLYRTSLTPSGSFESSFEEQTLTQNYSFIFRPLKILSIIPAFVQTDYWNVRNGSPLKTKAQSTDLKTKLTIFKSTINGLYSLKATTRLSDMITRHKSLYSLKVSRGVFTWGTLVFSHSYEHNGGEVLSGGTFPNQDYLKSINDLSLKFKIPTNTMNAVLNSINLTLRGKILDYRNNLNSGDNFKASSISFEGKMNF